MEPATNLLSLPHTFLIQTFEYLGESDLHKMSLVSKRCMFVSNQDILWNRSLVKRGFLPIENAKKEVVKFFKAFVTHCFSQFTKIHRDLSKAPQDVFEKREQFLQVIKTNYEKHQLEWMMTTATYTEKPENAIHALIEVGIPPKQDDIFYCVRSKHSLEVIRTCIKAGSPVWSGLVERALEEKNSEETIRLFLETGVNLEDRTNILYYALLNEYSFDIIKALVKSKAPLNNSSLIINALDKKLSNECITFLVEKGAPVTENTLKMALVWNQDQDLILLFLSKLQTVSGKVLDAAVKEGVDSEIIHKILAKGARPLPKTLEHALEKKYSAEVIQALCKAKAPLGEDPIKIALSSYDEPSKIVDLLHEAGVRVTDDAFAAAFIKGSEDLIRKLMEKTHAPKALVMTAALISGKMTPELLKEFLKLNPDLEENHLALAVNLKKEQAEFIILELLERGLKPTRAIIAAAVKAGQSEEVIQMLRAKFDISDVD